MNRSMVYIVDSGSGAIKVGVTSNMLKRLAQFQHASPHEVTVVNTWKRKLMDAEKVEKLAHRILKQHHIRGEWFSCAPEVGIKAVDLAIKIVDTGDKKLAPWYRDGEVIEAMAIAIHEKRVEAKDAYEEFALWVSDQDQVDYEVERWNRKQAKKSAKETEE